MHCVITVVPVITVDKKEFVAAIAPPAREWTFVKVEELTDSVLNSFEMTPPRQRPAQFTFVAVIKETATFERPRIPITE